MLELFQSFTIVPVELRPWFYFAGLAVLLLAVGGMWSRIRIWGLGEVEKRGPLAGAGVGRLTWLSLTKLFTTDCLFARRVFERSRWRGLMVMAFVWSSIAFILAVDLSAIFYFAGRAIPGDLVLGANPILDVAGLLLMLGLLAALVRHFFFRPERWISVTADGALLILFTLTVISGMLMEGARLVGSEATVLAQWPVGAMFAVMLRLVNSQVAFWAQWYPAIYLIHAGAGFALVAYLPFSNLFHLFATQITTYAASQRKKEMEK